MSTADTKVKTETRTKVTNYEPSMWKVIFHNDDVTPMQFVTQILIEIFNKTEDQAVNLCKTIHEKGKGVVAEGKLQDRKYFIADRILAKHDENYMPPELKNIMKENAK